MALKIHEALSTGKPYQTDANPNLTAAPLAQAETLAENGSLRNTPWRQQ